MEKKLKRIIPWSKSSGVAKMVRCMKLTLAIFLLTALQTWATVSYSQSTTLSINLTNAKVQTVLQQIENQSEFYFLYSSSITDVNRTVSMQLKDAKITEVLNKLFKETDVVYKVEGRQIVLSKNSEDFENFENAVQQKSVSGKVTDSSGGTLPGVSVVLKGTTIGTITDNNGNYSLLNVPENATLHFSFVGMKTQEIAVGGKTTINVTLAEDAIGLEEVVAIGYGTMKKKNLTGAVDLVSGEEFDSRPIRSLGEGLQGFIPNLNVQISNGDPTSSPSFNVRGFESISGGGPLILIDGIPGDINKVNPTDVKSVNVLKDAAAAAVYGARGAFGVILVETKQGQKGEGVNIDFSAEFSMKQPIWNADPVTDPLTHVEWMNIASINQTGNPKYSAAFVQNVKNWTENPTPENAWGVNNGNLEYYGDNNYQDQILSWASPQQNYSLNVSGGSDRATYYASFGHVNTDGLLKIGNDNFKRYNALLKNATSITDWLMLDSNISFNAVNSDQPFVQHWGGDVSGALTMLTRMTPADPFIFPKQEYFQDELPASLSGRDYSGYEGMFIGSMNLVPDIQDGGRKQFQNSEIRLHEKIILNPIKNLEIRGEFGYQLFNQRQKEVVSNVDKIDKLDLFQENLIGYGVTSNDYVRNDYTQNHYYTINTVAEYGIDRVGGSPHSFNALIGFNQEWNDNNSTYARGNDLISSSVREISATTGTQTAGGGKSQMSLRGGFYRLSYRYDDRYLFELNGRYDGTSRFPKADRFGFFPSFSAAWRVSEESFMDDVDFLDNLKIRGSYGSLGNQNVPYYAYITTMGNGLANYMMGGAQIPYVSSAGLVSPTLTWETVSTKNIGVDLGFFNNKLTANFDAYIRETKDMLMNKSYPSILGTTAPKQNAANLETRGWEFRVSYADRIVNDWSYEVAFNLSDWMSEITKYENPTGNYNDYYIGKKIGEIWGFETVGIIQDEEELQSMEDQSKIGSGWKVGNIRYKDLDGDGKITTGNNTISNPGDKKIIGNSTPRYSYGMQFNFTYKNLALRTFFQGVGSRDFSPPNQDWQWFWPFSSGVIDKRNIEMSWSEDNRDAYFYKPELFSGKNRQPQTRYLQDASYIRLKNISLNYTLPKQALSFIGFKSRQSVQIYLTGMNLWEYSKIKEPFDPEYVFSGTMTPYPLQRTYSIGAKLSF